MHEEGYPVTVNDAAVAAPVVLDAARRAARGAARAPSCRPRSWAPRTSPTCCERVPGAMAFLGACPPGLDPATAPANHSNLVVFDEEPLPAGVALYAQMAMHALAG